MRRTGSSCCHFPSYLLRYLEMKERRDNYSNFIIPLSQGEVSRWRGTISSPFPSALSQTTHTRFPCMCATLGIVWRFAIGFSVFRDAFHFFLTPCFPLHEPILRSARRSSSCTCSLAELCTPSFTHKSTLRRLTESGLSDNLCF